MTTQPSLYDLCSLGNTCIDIVATVSDEFLTRHDMIKSQNKDIDLAETEALYAALPDAKFIPGGVGANVAHVFCALGGRGIFHGIAGCDHHAAVFETYMKDHGIAIQIATPSDHHMQTTQVFCLNTPDGDRSFASYDDALKTYSAKDIDAALIKSSRITYLDGHMMVSSQAPEAFHHAITLSHAAGHLTCYNPADIGHIIDQPEILRNLAMRARMIICNLSEAQALFGDMSIEQLVTQLATTHKAGAITDGSNGATVFLNGNILHIPPADISKLATIDSNGAGDHFAGGFLYGLSHDLPLAQCGQLGQLCARDCLSHPGARPLGSLKHLLSALTKI